MMSLLRVQTALVEHLEKRLKQYVKRLTNNESVILDRDMLLRSLQFYSTLAEWMVLQAGGMAK